MAHWLLKSEPSSYSWDRLVADGRTHWDGVRNPQALNSLRAMKLGDRAFFYHSNEGKDIVGIVRVSKTYAPDPTDKTGTFGAVEVEAARALKSPVPLAVIKEHAQLKNMAFVKQSRLSVSPVTAAEWKGVCALGETGARGA